MIKRILITLVLVVMTLVAVGMCLPLDYEIQRTMVVFAPEQRIFPLISDLEHWPEWEPFTRNDPTNKTTLGEKTTGVGASQSWVGQQNSGRLTLTYCEPNDGILYDLVFTNGDRESPAEGSITMHPRGAGVVEVKWRMHGKLNMPVIGGYFAMFADRLIGPDFERGLAQLKARAELPASLQK